MILRATRKLLARLQPAETAPEASTTLLGDWYATYLPWGSGHVAILISDTTLLPVLMPLAPAKTLLARFPDALAEILHAHQVPDHVIAHERGQMADTRCATTASRSRLGTLNDFSLLATATRDHDGRDLAAMAMWLSTVPCGPLYKRHITPADELANLVRRPPTQQ